MVIRLIKSHLVISAGTTQYNPNSIEIKLPEVVSIFEERKEEYISKETLKEEKEDPREIIAQIKPDRINLDNLSSILEKLTVLLEIITREIEETRKETEGRIALSLQKKQLSVFSNLIKRADEHAIKERGIEQKKRILEIVRDWVRKHCPLSLTGTKTNIIFKAGTFQYPQEPLRIEVKPPRKERIISSAEYLTTLGKIRELEAKRQVYRALEQEMNMRLANKYFGDKKRKPTSSIEKMPPYLLKRPEVQEKTPLYLLGYSVQEQLPKYLLDCPQIIKTIKSDTILNIEESTSTWLVKELEAKEDSTAFKEIDEVMNLIEKRFKADKEIKDIRGVTTYLNAIKNKSVSTQREIDEIVSNLKALVIDQFEYQYQSKIREKVSHE